MLIKKIVLMSVLSVLIAPTFAAKPCCSTMGGANYCDSSAGRLVCNNGFYSACSCTPHAVTNLQFLESCCLCKGRVSAPYTNSETIQCNDGSISEECSFTSLSGY